MADIQYLNYGDLQVELLAFLNKAANEVQSYVQKLPWSNKRKLKFMSAYSDIINKGLIGASNDTGRWMIDVSGVIDLDSMSKKDKEMYLEAAYFIQQLMAGLPTKSSLEEKKDESLPKFENFLKNFTDYISANYFGNNKFRIGSGENDDWNYLDERGLNGLRERTNRAERLANYLEEYSKTLEDGKYDYSPYGSYNDLKNKINTAITRLRDKTWNQDDRDALNAIGLRSSDWLNDGSGDYTTDANGNRITYGELANLPILLSLLQLLLPEVPVVLTPEQDKEKTTRDLTGENSNWETEDYARIIAALGDVVSLGGLHANLIGSGVSLISDTVADIADENLSSGDVFSNLFTNTGWALAGFIPGAKLGKIGKNLIRFAPKLMVLLLDIGIYNDPSHRKTFDKIKSGRILKDGFSSEDLKNVTYWVRAITGTANAAKSGLRDLKYDKARGTAGQKFKAKDGEEVTLSNKAVDEINAVGARKGQKAAEDMFKEKTGHEVADNEFNFSENGRRGWFKDYRSKFLDSRLKGESTVFRTSLQQRYYDLLKQDRELGGRGGWRWIGSRGTSSYFDHFDSGIIGNPLRGLRKKLDPYRGMVETSAPSRTPSPDTPTGGRAATTSNAKEIWKDVLKGKHSGNNLSLEKFEVEGFTFEANKYPGLESGVLDVSFNGNKTSISFNNQKDLMKKVLKYLKDNKVKITVDGKSKTDMEKMGKVLTELKNKGVFKQGGRIDKLKIQIYKKYIKDV